MSNTENKNAQAFERIRARLRELKNGTPLPSLVKSINLDELPTDCIDCLVVIKILRNVNDDQYDTLYLSAYQYLEKYSHPDHLALIELILS